MLYLLYKHLSNVKPNHLTFAAKGVIYYIIIVSNNFRNASSFSSHTLYFISCKSFCHLHPQIAKARRGRRRGKVTAVITDNIIIVK